jgi:nitrate reductase alpha subunit
VRPFSSITTRQQAYVDRLQLAAFGEKVFHCTVDLIVGNGVDTQGTATAKDNQQQNQ